jgi:uncharacterized protein
MTTAIDAIEEDYLYTMDSQIPNAGKGLYTAIDIYQNEVIGHFKGEIIIGSEVVRRSSLGEDQYFIIMLDGTIMDSKHTACFAKYANDAEGSIKTTFRNNAKIALDEDDKVSIVATRKIKSGEEIFCGYGRKYWAKHGSKL